MSIKYQVNEFRCLGLNIDLIVNSIEAKERAKSLWKIQCQFRKFEKQKEDEIIKKYWAWVDKYAYQTALHIRKFGDVFPVIQKFRFVTNILKKFWLEISFIYCLIWLIRRYH